MHEEKRAQGKTVGAVLREVRYDRIERQGVSEIEGFQEVGEDCGVVVGDA